MTDTPQAPDREEAVMSDQFVSKDWAWRMAAMLRFMRQSPEAIGPRSVAHIDALLMGPTTDEQAKFDAAMREYRVRETGAATEIVLGDGLVDMGEMEQAGRKGFLLRNRNFVIPPGQPGELQNTEYTPIKGDVVIWFKDSAAKENFVAVVNDHLAALPAPSDESLRK